MTEKFMGKTGAPIKSHTMIYKAVVQVMLLYGSKNWVVMDAMVTVIEGFHNRIARRIAGMTASKGNRGEYEWASVDASLESTSLCPIREYVRRRQATIA